MWSRSFLLTGLASATAIAVLTLAGMWSAMHAAIDGQGATFANMTLYGFPAVVAYPACWYFGIFRMRDYSLSQTLVLVGSTFGVVAALIWTGSLAATIYFAISVVIHGAHIGRMDLLLIVGAPIGVLIWLIIGTMMVSIPYLVVATPMAFLHRWLLMRTFAPRAPTMVPHHTAI